MKGDLQFEAPTWNQLYKMLLTQSHTIRCSNFKPEIIVGVSRGGLIPARILSDLLENPNLANVRTESYIGLGEANVEPTLTQHLSIDISDKAVLIVDDIADSGRSLKLITKYVESKGAKEVKTATVYIKRQCLFKSDFFEIETDNWIVFPWEIMETMREIKEHCKVNAKSVNVAFSKLANAGVSKKLITKVLKDVLGTTAC